MLRLSNPSSLPMRRKNESLRSLVDPMIEENCQFSPSALYFRHRDLMAEISMAKISLAKMEMKASMNNKESKKLLKQDKYLKNF